MEVDNMAEADRMEALSLEERMRLLEARVIQLESSYERERCGIPATSGDLVLTTQPGSKCNKDDLPKRKRNNSDPPEGKKPRMAASQTEDEKGVARISGSDTRQRLLEEKANLGRKSGTIGGNSSGCGGNDVGIGGVGGGDGDTRGGGGDGDTRGGGGEGDTRGGGGDGDTRGDGGDGDTRGGGGDGDTRGGGGGDEGVSGGHTGGGNGCDGGSKGGRGGKVGGGGAGDGGDGGRKGGGGCRERRGSDCCNCGEKALIKLRLRMGRQQEEMVNLGRQLQTANRTVDRLQSAVALHKSSGKKLRQELAQARKENVEAVAKLRATKELLATAESRVSEFQFRVEGVLAKLDESRQLEAAGRKLVEELRGGGEGGGKPRRLVELEEEMAALLAAVQSQRAGFNEKTNGLMEQIAALTSQLEEKTRSRTELEQRFKTVTEELAAGLREVVERSATNDQALKARIREVMTANREFVDTTVEDQQSFLDKLRDYMDARRAEDSDEEEYDDGECPLDDLYVDMMEALELRAADWSGQEDAILREISGGNERG